MAAHTAKMTSIALPAIGTGRLGVPHDVAAKLMFDEAIDFSQTNPSTTLQTICFVLYDKDRESLKVGTHQACHMTLISAWSYVSIQ